MMAETVAEDLQDGWNLVTRAEAERPATADGLAVFLREEVLA
jgi:hypothetical protein